MFTYLLVPPTPQHKTIISTKNWGQADKDLLADLTNRQLTAVSARHRHGDQGIAAATTALLVPWVRPLTRCVWAGAAHAASDREGFDACGEEDRAERPAHEGNGAGTGGSWRVAAPHPQRQQLYGLDAAHSELTTMAVTTVTGREHEDCDGGGDCEDVTMEGGSHRSLGGHILHGQWGRWR